MSVVVRIKGVRFQIHLGDHEPPHCHVYYQGAVAKVRLDTFQATYARGYSEQAVREIERLVEKHQEALMAKWEEYYGKKETDEEA